MAWPRRTKPFASQAPSLMGISFPSKIKNQNKKAKKKKKKMKKKSQRKRKRKKKISKTWGSVHRQCLERLRFTVTAPRKNWRSVRHQCLQAPVHLSFHTWDRRILARRHCLQGLRFITVFSDVSTQDLKMKITRKCLKRLRFTFLSILETEAYWLAVTAFKGTCSSPF